MIEVVEEPGTASIAKTYNLRVTVAQLAVMSCGE